MYASAEQFIREQDKAAAQAQLMILWRNALYYGDPADLAQIVSLPPPMNYEQALAQQAQEQALAEQQARLKPLRKRSIISISLTIVSIVLSMIAVIAALHLSLILIIIASIVGLGAGAAILQHY